MLKWSFVVEDIREAYGGICYILVRPTTEDGFYITEASTLAGVPIYQWIKQPRSRGIQRAALREGFFAFALQRATDVKHFSLGERVVLESPEGVRVCRQCGAKVPWLGEPPILSRETRVDKARVMSLLKTELGLDPRAAKAWALHLCGPEQLCHRCGSELPKGDEVTCRHCDALNVKLPEGMV